MDVPIRQGSAEPAAPRQRHRRLLTTVLLAITLLLPSVVLAAASPFSDVDPGNTFYTNIVNMANSGITSGCGGGKFCPKDNVTREQMSAFLNRAAPRASAVDFASPLGATPGGAAAHGGTVASLTVTSLNNEYLFISTAFFAFTYNTAGTFPCENSYRFRVDGSTVGVTMMYDRINTVPPNTWVTNNIAGQTLTPVGPGSHTVTLVYVDGEGSCSNYPGVGTMSAMVIPFAGNMNSIP